MLFYSIICKTNISWNSSTGIIDITLTSIGSLIFYSNVIVEPINPYASLSLSSNLNFSFQNESNAENQLTFKCTARSAWMHCKENTICNVLVKNGNFWSFRLDFGIQCTISSKYSWSNEEVFDAKRIPYSELGFASRILNHKFMLHGLWCNVLMSHGC